MLRSQMLRSGTLLTLLWFSCQHPDVRVSSEEKVLDSVLAWAASKEEVGGWEDAEKHIENHVSANVYQPRENQLQGLLPLVRFPLMPMAVLRKVSVALSGPVEAMSTFLLPNAVYVNPGVSRM